MARFSDRLGITNLPKELQIEGMNGDLRVSLWNWAVEVINIDNGTDSIPIIWKDYLKRPLHKCSVYQSIDLGWLHDHFMKSAWHEVYNFIEFVLQNIVNKYTQVRVLPEYGDKLNRLLERELAGYRVINLELVPITDRQEIEAVREAISPSSATSFGLEGPRKHIAKALSLLSKRPEPDYPNSIKESISAVESICKLLTGEKSGGIDKALAKLSFTGLNSSGSSTSVVKSLWIHE